MEAIRAVKSILGIGNPDGARRADVISHLAEESVAETRELNEQLQQYARSEDPFKAMVIDLHNRRAAIDMARQHKLQ